MTRNRQIIDIFADRDQGVTTDAEALKLFGYMQIHGAFRSDGHFTGYDYLAQRWLDESA